MFNTILPYSREEILYSWLARMKTYYGYSMIDAKKNFFIYSKKNL